MKSTTIQVSQYEDTPGSVAGLGAAYEPAIVRLVRVWSEQHELPMFTDWRVISAAKRPAAQSA
jgi:hypothetical protein